MVLMPNLNDYDINVLILLGNQADDTFRYNQIKLAIVDKLLILSNPMFFLVNKFICSNGILKEAYAETIVIKMKDSDYYIEDTLIDEILKLVSFDTLIYYGADSNSINFSLKCKEEFDNRAKKIEDKNEMIKKRNLGKIRKCILNEER